MPEFTVKIKDAVVEADSPKLAAMRTAEAIAIMETINMFTVVDENGIEHQVILTPAEVNQVIAEAEIKKDGIR